MIISFEQLHLEVKDLDDKKADISDKDKFVKNSYTKKRNADYILIGVHGFYHYYKVIDHRAIEKEAEV